MTLNGHGTGYLIAYDAAVLGETAELHPFDIDRFGRLRLVEKQEFNAAERTGPVDQTMWFSLLAFDRDPLYVLDYG